MSVSKSIISSTLALALTAVPLSLVSQYALAKTPLQVKNEKKGEEAKAKSEAKSQASKEKSASKHKK